MFNESPVRSPLVVRSQLGEGSPILGVCVSQRNCHVYSSLAMFLSSQRTPLPTAIVSDSLHFFAKLKVSYLVSSDGKF